MKKRVHAVIIAGLCVGTVMSIIFLVPQSDERFDVTEFLIFMGFFFGLVSYITILIMPKMVRMSDKLWSFGAGATSSKQNSNATSSKQNSNATSSKQNSNTTSSKKDLDKSDVNAENS